MELEILTRSNKPLATFNLDSDATVGDLKKLFHSKNASLYPERQWFTVDEPRGAPLKKDSDTLKSYGVTQGTKLYFKDLGHQISWRMVFVIEYFGPILIFPLFYYFPKFFYPEFADNVPEKTWTQQLGLILGVGHFVKREFESVFIHRFSHACMPLYRVPINCTHYWFFCGLGIAYFLFHPKYTDSGLSDTAIYMCIGTFIFAEIMNFNCHVILRDLRPVGSTKRGIPHGGGFDYVSCANYFWELVAWLAFAYLVKCLTAWFFLLVSFVQINEWAQKRHRNYLSEFDGKKNDKYPANRKALIPFLLQVFMSIE